jgi:hypothetical protein
VVLFFIFRGEICKLGAFFEDVVEKKKILRTVLIILLICFAFFAYLTKPIFYSVYACGVIGDSMAFAGMALEKNIYIFPKHISHPLFAQQIIRLLMKLRVILPQSENFKEDVFIWSSLPMRIFASIGLFIMFTLFRKILKFSFLTSFLASAFLGVSFVYWCWAIQPNALSIAIVFEIFTILCVLKAIRNNSWKWFLFLAIFTSLCIYVHIATVYFCIGIIFFVLLFFIKQKIYYKNFKLLNLLVYFLIIINFGLIFYLISLHAFALCGQKIAFTDFDGFLEILSDYCMFGRFKIPLPSQALIMLKENFITGVVNIFGIWLSVNLLEKLLITISIGCMIPLVFVFFIKIKSVWRIYRLELLCFFVLFFVILTGFIIRNGGTHYYSVSLPVNISIFLLILFGKTERKKLTQFSIPVLIILIVCLFIFNGFSSKTVYGGRNVRDHIVYSIYDDLRKISNGKSLYFFEPLDLNYWLCSEANFGPISHYYNEKFSNIKWITNFSEKDIYMQLKSEPDIPVYIGKTTYKYLCESKTINKFKLIDCPEYNDFYRIKLK